MLASVEDLTLLNLRPRWIHTGKRSTVTAVYREECKPFERLKLNVKLQQYSYYLYINSRTLYDGFDQRFEAVASRFECI